MDITEPETLARKSLYQQLFEVLHKRIMDGTLPENSYIPNEYDLTREFKVSIGTVRKAVDMLVRDKLLIRQQGKGTMVADRRWIGRAEKLNRLRHIKGYELFTWTSRDVRTRLGVTNAAVAERLQLPTENKINVLTHILKDDRNAVLFETVYFSADLFEAIPDDQLNQIDVLDFIAINGYSVGRVEETATAVLASPQGAKLMALEVGTPLLKTERIVYEKRGYPLELRISYAYLPDGCFFVASE